MSDNFLIELNKLDISKNPRYMIYVMSQKGPFQYRSLLNDWQCPIPGCWTEWYDMKGYPDWNWSTRQYRIKEND